MGDGDVPISVCICFWNPEQVKLAPCGLCRQDGLYQACGLPVSSGQPPAAWASLVLLNCCPWFRSATSALAICFPFPSSCFPPNPPHPPNSHAAFGPMETSRCYLPIPLWRHRQSLDLSLASRALCSCCDMSGLDSPDCTLETQHCYWIPPI